MISIVPGGSNGHNLWFESCGELDGTSGLRLNGYGGQAGIDLEGPLGINNWIPAGNCTLYKISCRCPCEGSEGKCDPKKTGNVFGHELPSLASALFDG